MSGKRGKKNGVNGMVMGLLLYGIILMILLSVLAAMFRGNVLKEGQMKLAAIICLGVSSFICSLLAVGKRKKGRLLFVLMPMGEYLLLALIMCLLFRVRLNLGGLSWVAILANLLPALAVGVGGLKRRAK